MTRAITISVQPTERLLRACAMFGLRVERASRAQSLDQALRRRANQAASAIDRALEPRQVCFITGPSGGGKSNILRALLRRLRIRRAPIVECATSRLTRGPRQPVVDCLDAPLEETLRALAHAGLAEAMLFARAPDELSDGQRWRLALALAMHDANRRANPRTPATLVIDEFAAVLDRTTASTVAATAARWARAASVRLVCSTAHDDLAPALRPDLTVTCPLDDEPTFSPAPGRQP